MILDRLIKTRLRIAMLMIASVLCVYAVAYYMLVDRCTRVPSVKDLVGVVQKIDKPRESIAEALIEPCYAVGGGGAEAFFAPMHGVDRVIRPTYWKRLIKPKSPLEPRPGRD